MQNVSAHPDAAQSFYQTYYTDILQHMFSVVTDTSHTAGLTMHATILAYMFTLVESEKVTLPLNLADKTVTNMVHIQGFVANLLKTAFPHLSDNQIKITVTGLFNLDQDIPGFKDHLRDFLVQIREFTGEDDTDLYLEEREVSRCGISKEYGFGFAFAETYDLFADCPEGGAGREEEGADVGARDPEPARGGGGDAGLEATVIATSDKPKKHQAAAAAPIFCLFFLPSSLQGRPAAQRPAKDPPRFLKVHLTWCTWCTWCTSPGHLVYLVHLTRAHGALSAPDQGT